jgi:hypothetical protein
MTGWRVGAAIAAVLAAISAVPVVIAYLSGYDVELVYRSAVGIGVNSVTVGYIIGWPVFEYVSRDLPPLIVTVPVAVVVLALPMWGIHRGIVAAKDAELERATVAMRDAAADSERHLLWWLYRQQVAQSPEWPVAARSATRIALYVVIPPLAWIGAALVQDAVANVLGLH